MPIESGDGTMRRVRALAAACALVACALAAGCIADTPEDSDLPWASDRGWEGMVPMPMGAGGYD